MMEDVSLMTLVHVSHEWGVRPSAVLDWGKDEYRAAVAYLKRIAEVHKPKES